MEFAHIKPADCTRSHPPPASHTKKSSTSLPLVSLFPLPFMHIRAFVCRQRVHAASESIFKASLRPCVTGPLRFWVYYCWDVSFLVKTHRCRWIQIWRHPRPGDVFSILFSHSSNTISLVAFYLPFLLLPPYAPQRLLPPVFPFFFSFFSTLPACSCSCLRASLLKGTLVHGLPHLPPALSFN